MHQQVLDPRQVYDALRRTTSKKHPEISVLKLSMKLQTSQSILREALFYLLLRDKVRVRTVTYEVAGKQRERELWRLVR